MFVLTRSNHLCHAAARRYNASQVSWLVDGVGRLLVDDVFKLEELEDRWPVLQKRICGLASVPYSSGGPRRNPSQHQHYSTYYDERSRALVAEYMQADLTNFGYRFEIGPSPVERAS